MAFSSPELPHSQFSRSDCPESIPEFPVARRGKNLRLSLLRQTPIQRHWVESSVKTITHILHEINAGGGSAGFIFACAPGIAARSGRCLVGSTSCCDTLWSLGWGYGHAAVAVVRRLWVVVPRLLWHVDGQRCRGVGRVVSVCGRHDGMRKGTRTWRQ